MINTQDAETGGLQVQGQNRVFDEMPSQTNKNGAESQITPTPKHIQGILHPFWPLQVPTYMWETHIHK